jgi:RNA polymerase sigma factor (sigma-70 family)
MTEGKRVAAGEAILSGVATIERREDERSRVERTNQVLEALVREHSRLVYRIAYAVLRRHHDAEDATQETFMRVLRYSSKLGAVEDPKTWLARIAWRVAVDRVRQPGAHARDCPGGAREAGRRSAFFRHSGGSDRTRHAGQRSAGADDCSAPGKAAPATDPIDDRRDVAPGGRRDSGDQRSGSAVANFPGAADSARKAGRRGEQ